MTDKQKVSEAGLKSMFRALTIRRLSPDFNNCDPILALTAA